MPVCYVFLNVLMYVSSILSLSLLNFCHYKYNQNEKKKNIPNSSAVHLFKKNILHIIFAVSHRLDIPGSFKKEKKNFESARYLSMYQRSLSGYLKKKDFFLCS